MNHIRDDRAAYREPGERSLERRERAREGKNRRRLRPPTPPRSCTPRLNLGPKPRTPRARSPVPRAVGVENIWRTSRDRSPRLVGVRSDGEGEGGDRGEGRKAGGRES